MNLINVEFEVNNVECEIEIAMNGEFVITVKKSFLHSIEKKMNKVIICSYS